MNRFLVRAGPVAALLGLLGVDLLLKSWALQALPDRDSVVVPGLLHLGFTLNTGMAWGLLGERTAPLAALRLLVGLGLLVALLRGGWSVPQRYALALIGAGALGNAVDGLTRGAVVDYLTSPALDRISLWVSAQPFPIFNLADMLVIAGVLVLGIRAFERPVRAPNPTQGES